MHDFGKFAIVAWYGSIANIPKGWVLCDGNNGTPDLRDRFVVAAENTYTPGDSGGDSAHEHDFTGDGHVHVFGLGAEIGSDIDYSDTTNATQVTGTTDPKAHLPKFHSLYYIMEK